MLVSRNVQLWQLAVFLVYLIIYVSWSAQLGAEGIKCRQPERAVLLDFKKAAEDFHSVLTQTTTTIPFSDEQKERNVWFKWDEEEAEECCNWQGVTCDAASGRITQLRLPSACAEGQYYDSTSFSSPPIYCYHQDAYECGPLPSSLSRLESLEVLDVRGGCFSINSAVPIFSSLINLSHLDLSSNPFHTLPDLPLLPHLIYLNLSNLHHLNDESLTLSSSKLFHSAPNVQYLDLGNNFLQGVIPEQIGSLHNLRYLDLHFNSLRGVIPHQIGSLPNLSYLDLRYNDLEGVIPQQIGSLQNMIYLDLWGNSFDNPLPWPSLANLSRLAHLSLGSYTATLVWPEARADWQCKWKALESLSILSINFTSTSKISLPFCLVDPALATQLKHLHFQRLQGSSIALLLCSLSHTNASLSLETLSLPFNSLQELQTEHCKLQGMLHTPLLQVLDLSNNQLTGIPSWLPHHLPLLHSLDMSSNDLSTYPPQLEHLLALKSLSLSKNAIKGNIPLYLLKPSLLYLDVSGNHLSGTIPFSLGNLSHLSYLNMASNLLSGMLPFSIGNLSHLFYLSLSDNSFTGEIPHSLGDLSSLAHLDLSYNSLKGEIPPSIGNMSKLVYLYLENNKYISGSIPLSLGGLSSLRFLLLSGNALTRTISSSIFQDSLEYVDLSKNQLVGSLPTLQNCSSLNELVLSNNLLGSLLKLHEVLQNCPLLAQLDLSSNRFSGSLPPSCNQLVRLDISKNHIGGEVPREMGKNCSNLQFLDLSDNNLSGGLPAEIGNISGLKTLTASKNFLSLDIPASLGNLPSLEFLALHNNRLNGRLPRALQNCSSLEILDVSFNRLSGSIPEWMNGQNFPDLKFLMLSSNQLQGSTPQLVSLVQNFSRLQILGLASNHLTGSIPTNLDRLQAMRSALKSGTIEHVDIDVQFTAKRIQESLLKGSLEFLTALDFSDNLLEGGIPPEIGALQALYSLNLSHNSLNGSIPSSFAKLAGVLESLDLSNNKLTGSILQELCYFDSLGVLDLSHNQLHGVITASSSCTRLCSFDASCFADNDGLRYECSAAATRIDIMPPAQAVEGASHHTSLMDKLQDSISVAGWGIGHVLGFLLMGLFLRRAGARNT